MRGGISLKMSTNRKLFAETAGASWFPPLVAPSILVDAQQERAHANRTSTYSLDCCHALDRSGHGCSRRAPILPERGLQ